LKKSSSNSQQGRKKKKRSLRGGKGGTEKTLLLPSEPRKKEKILDYCIKGVSFFLEKKGGKKGENVTRSAPMEKDYQPRLERSWKRGNPIFHLLTAGKRGGEEREPSLALFLPRRLPYGPLSDKGGKEVFPSFPTDNGRGKVRRGRGPRG